ncbi:unnamed protein product [Protopolystoma xenopodis]|uniref:Uncharacterized protein n=1 Tax=Protopolystoma xenopodis TaxID=117903 RepID=A0A3S5CPR8_9PLAT|nr:unnamed protein product [Protopolystoma xenopodis]
MVKYFARGTALFLCAAHRLGMFFDAGYIWFLSPWLQVQWWEDLFQPRPSSGPPDMDCTGEQLASMTQFAFALGLGLASGYLSQTNDLILGAISESGPHFRGNSSGLVLGASGAASSFAETQFIPPLSFSLASNLSPSATPDYPSVAPTASSSVSSSSSDAGSVDMYKWYTYEAIVILGQALKDMLLDNPSAVSILHTVNGSNVLRDYVSRVRLDMKTGTASGDPTSGEWLPTSSISSTSILRPLADEAVEDIFGPHEARLRVRRSQADSGDIGVLPTASLRSAIQHQQQQLLTEVGIPSDVDLLRFNSENERDASIWVLRQYDVNSTLPIFVWVANNTLPMSSGNHSRSGYEEFMATVTRKEMERVHWSNSTNGRPPSDGSAVAERACVFGFLTKPFGLSCVNASVLASIAILLILMTPLVLCFAIHYKRKLREAENRTKKPYEELCAELADLDVGHIYYAFVFHTSIFPRVDRTRN